MECINQHQKNGGKYKPKYPLIPAKSTDSYGNTIYGPICGWSGLVRLLEFTSFCGFIYIIWAVNYQQYMVTWIATILISLIWLLLYTQTLFYVMLCNHCLNKKLFWYWSIPMSSNIMRGLPTTNEFVKMSLKEFTLKRTQLGYVGISDREINAGLLQKDQLLEQDLGSVQVMIYGSKWYQKNVCKPICWVICHFILWGFLCYQVIGLAYFDQVWDLDFY